MLWEFVFDAMCQ